MLAIDAGCLLFMLLFGGGEFSVYIQALRNRSYLPQLAGVPRVLTEYLLYIHFQSLSSFIVHICLSSRQFLKSALCGKYVAYRLL